MYLQQPNSDQSWFYTNSLYNPFLLHTNIALLASLDAMSNRQLGKALKCHSLRKRIFTTPACQ